MSEETLAGKQISRRAFLNQSATIAAGAAVLGSTALSYGRIVGANDRISLGHIGIGNRGGELDWIASRLKDKHNVEMTAVCDLWRVNREKAVARNREYYGREPRAFQYLEDLLALKDVDAVLISTPGSAAAIASGLDATAWPEIVGTVAGDDTVFVALAPQPRAYSALAQRLARLGAFVEPED